MPWKHASGLVYSEAEYLKLEEKLKKVEGILGYVLDEIPNNDSYNDIYIHYTQEMVEWYNDYREKREASFNDLKGEAPDITGDLSSEDFVAKGREGWETENHSVNDNFNGLLP